MFVVLLTAMNAACLLVAPVFASSSADTADLVQMSLQSKATSALLSTSFEDYVASYAREYQPGSDEYAQRRGLYQRRLEAINAQNSKPDRSWTAGLNALTDRTDTEYEALFGWRGRGRHHASGTSLFAGAGKQRHNASRAKPPPAQTRVDWSDLVSLHSSRDQGSCGSCWAVATAAMLEGRYEVHHKETRSFSVQELVNCVPNEGKCGGTGGCQGATVELAMEYVKEKGLAAEEDIKYTARTGKCHKDNLFLQEKADIEGNAVKGLSSWETLPSNTARPLMEALLTGPVAVSAAASSWAGYSHGIFDGCTGSKGWIVNHAVIMVGYGSDAGKEYWKIKNSWGANWGERSYMRIMRLSTDEKEDANCGTDTAPGDGVECVPYPDTVEVCGHCGVLYDSVLGRFGVS